MGHFVQRIRFTLLFCFSISLAGAQTTIMQEDFQGGGMPSQWSQQTAASDGGWQHGDASSLSSNYFSIPAHTDFVATNDDACNCDKSNEYLITDTLDLSSYSSVVLEFDRYYEDQSYQGNAEELYIRVSTDSGSTWSTVDSLAGVGEWRTETFDISSYVGGNSGVLIAFRYDDNGGWLYGAAVDNVRIYKPMDRNLEMSDIDVDRYVQPTSSVSVKGTITNLGGNTVNSFDLKWRTDGGTIHTENVTGLSLNTFDTYQFTHTDNINVSSAGLQDLEVWVESPNGNTDMDMSNDSLGQAVVGMDSIPEKKALVEEATGSWCGYCPDGAVKLENTLDDNANTLGVSIHYGDPMDFQDGITVLGTYISGFPGGMVDRHLFDGNTSISLNRSNWNTRAGEREQATVPADVSMNVSYDTNLRTIDVDVTASFYGPAKEDLRFNAYIVEDHVSDTTNKDYGQVNNYNNQSGHPYYQEGDTIWDYDHRHVLRKMLGGPWGTSGVIPASVSKGDTYTKSYSHTLPSDQKAKDVVVIGVLQRFNQDEQDRAILNVESDSSVMEIARTSIEDQQRLPSASIQVYPNPVNDRAKLDIRTDRALEGRIEVRDMRGRILKSERNVRVNPGASYMPIDMSSAESGVYFVRFITEKGVMTERFSVADR